jgi:hypothetical protein
MARDWLIDPIVTTSIQLQQPVSVDAKFLRRGAEKFLLKGMRLPGISGAIDFNEKIILRKRLDELAAAHVNALILSEAQAEAVLGVAGQAGLAAIVEIAIDADELAAPQRARVTIERVGAAMKLLRGYPALAGVVIDCRIDRGSISRIGRNALRGTLEAIARRIRESNGHLLVALKHRADAAEISFAGEDFAYLEVTRIDEAAAGAMMRAMHDRAGARPLVIEVGEEFPGEVEAVARGFGGGAAGVVAAAMRPAVSPGWQNVRMLSAGELPPFMHFGGSAAPLPAAMPLVSVVVSARDGEQTLAACLKSIGRLHYPNYEVIVIEEGSRERDGAAAADPGVRVIRGKAGDLRVEALRAARGELIAFTRADCAVDADWLTLAVQAIAEDGLDGCRGPVCPPREELRFAARVAAELEPSNAHADGLRETQIDVGAARNLVIRKSSLAASGGKAGRSINGNGDRELAALMPVNGLKIGWCPAGFVRRNGPATIGEFFRNQIAQGRREATAVAEDARPVRAAAEWHRFMEGQHNYSGAIAWAVANALAPMGGIVRAVARRHYLAKASAATSSASVASDDARASAHRLAIGNAHARGAHPVIR